MIKRDYRIDSIRGLLIVMMSVAHLGTLYKGYSGQLIGFVSAAEGFVFLSGFVYSIFYYKYTIDRNFLIKKSFTRALVIYKYHILSLILLLVLYYFIPFFAQFKTQWMKNIYNEPLIHLLTILLIIQQPPFFDILSMYVFFLLISPFVLLIKNKWIWIFLIVVSIVFWILGQHFNIVKFFSKLLFPDLKIFNGFFNIFSWQIIWFSGLAFGLYKNFKIKIRFIESRYFISFLILALIFFFLLKHNIILSEYEFSSYASRQKLGWLRLLNFWSLVIVIGYFMNVLIPQSGIPWLKYIGKYSLQVFSFHILFIYLFAPYALYLIISYGGFGFLLSVLIMLSCLAIPAYLYENVKKFKFSPSK